MYVCSLFSQYHLYDFTAAQFNGAIFHHYALSIIYLWKWLPFSQMKRSCSDCCSCTAITSVSHDNILAFGVNYVLIGSLTCLVMHVYMSVIFAGKLALTWRTSQPMLWWLMPSINWLCQVNNTTDTAYMLMHIPSCQWGQVVQLATCPYCGLYLVDKKSN